ncbi:MAG: glycerol-3-phosphate 1-O-acyltransferase PlsY [Gemmatimonadetes bacterium]|nr:glycerol-3-phosphate 1-O-acyltransferase PlsY [Gemmatimonadota bacterium]
MTAAMWLIVSYLLGSIPTSYLVGRLAKGIDLRQVGSKNLGATNLYRSLGWRYAIPVGLFDLAKGAIPVWVFGPRAGDGPWWPLALGVAAVVGHVFSVFVGFKGGKGVATTAGVVLGVAPWATLVALGLWAVVVRLTGYVSLGSIVAAAALPPAAFLLDPGSRPVVAALVAMAVFVIAMHRANIGRLLAGTENRFGRRGAP